MELVLGTANFGQAYGRKAVEAISPREIMMEAMNQMIVYLDTSMNYGMAPEIIDEFQQDVSFPSYPFRVIVKVVNNLQVELAMKMGNVHAILAHGIKAWGEVGTTLLERVPPNIKVGASLYKPSEIEGLYGANIQIIEFPYNIVDQSWASFLPALRRRRIETIARSVFLHGTLWENNLKGIPLAYMSFNMVKNNPFVDKLIVGPITKEELIAICTIPDLEVNYEHLSNPGSKKWIQPIAKQDPSLPLWKDGH